MGAVEMVVDGLFFPEGPRWRTEEGKLYFSDVMAGKVSRLDDADHVETVFTPGEYPNGLGSLGNGDLLVVTTESHEIVSVPRDAVLVGSASRADSVNHADISTPSGTGNNDMVVAPNGTAYAGAYLPGLSEEVPPGPNNSPPVREHRHGSARWIVADCRRSCLLPEWWSYNSRRENINRCRNLCVHPDSL
jgi:sugar lactone lactonase YvrE